MVEESFKRKLAAILSADVKGYSRLMGEDEVATVRTLTEYRQIMISLVRQSRGRVVDSPGDNLLAEFGSVVDAVECAVDIQEDLRARNAELPECRRMEFRIGINLGDVIKEGKRIYGDGVNIAARVEGLAEGGGICISGEAYDHVKNKLALAYDFLGEQRVKNITEPIRVYRVNGRPQPDSGKAVSEPELGGKPSVAVLPFVNMSGDLSQEYFSDGITENIITGLSGCPKLLVIARNSTFNYKGKHAKIQQVSEDLGARYVIEGSVQKAGDRVRITVQLIDATTGHHLWAERYDRDVENIFALQDEITIRIVTALEVKLTEGEQARLRLKGQPSLEAFMKGLKALAHFRRQNREDNILARQEIEEGVPLAPDYHAFYVLLAATYISDLWYGSPSPRASLARASELVDKAIELNKDDPDAYIVLSYLLLMRRRHQKAIAAAERAIALNPNGADAYAQLASALDSSGKPSQAIELYNKAIRLNPIPPSYYLTGVGHAYMHIAQFEKGIEAYEKAIHLEPTDLFAHLGLAAAFGLMGLRQKAQVSAAEVLSLDPQFSLKSHEKAIHHKNRDQLRNYIDALRKAGLQ
jgi:adenylate cyclase